MTETTHNRRLRAALIDMDGTLYDSMPSHAKAWQRTMHEIGIDLPYDEFFLYEGMRGADTIDMLIRRHLHRIPSEAELTATYALKAKYFAEMPPVGPIPGARQLIESLRRRGIVTVLVTGSGQASLLGRLEQDYPGAFPEERRVTSVSVLRGKPEPDPYLYGLKLAGCGPLEAFAIDNAPLGTRSAAAAGILTVGVTTGPIDRRVLADNGANIVYNSMEECAKMLPDLLDMIEAVAANGADKADIK